MGSAMDMCLVLLLLVHMCSAEPLEAVTASSCPCLILQKRSLPLTSVALLLVHPAAPGFWVPMFYKDPLLVSGLESAFSKPFLPSFRVQVFLLYTLGWWEGYVVSPGTLQKDVFIQFDCCYYVVKHSIKVVIYETCGYSWLFPVCFLFFPFFCFVIYQREQSQA